MVYFLHARVWCLQSILPGRLQMLPTNVFQIFSKPLNNLGFKNWILYDFWLLSFRNLLLLFRMQPPSSNDIKRDIRKVLNTIWKKIKVICFEKYILVLQISISYQYFKRSCCRGTNVQCLSNIGPPVMSPLRYKPP